MKANTDIQFDMEAALAGLREGKGLSGKDGIPTPLAKRLTEAAMQAGLDGHLTHEGQPNRKNGLTRKAMKPPAGEFGLASPRGRTPAVPKADENQGRLRQRKQFTQTAVCRYIEGIRTMGTPYSELEPDAVTDDDTLPRTARRTHQLIAELLHRILNTLPSYSGSLLTTQNGAKAWMRN